MPATPRPPVALAFGGLLSLAAAMGIGRFVYTPILPFMTAGLSMPPDDAGLIASANFLGYLAGALAGASRSLPGNPRMWFLGGLIASALTSAAMALTTALPLFLLIRFASGVASAFALVFSTSLILERLTAAGRGGLPSWWLCLLIWGRIGACSGWQAVRQRSAFCWLPPFWCRPVRCPCLAQHRCRPHLLLPNRPPSVPRAASA